MITNTIIILFKSSHRNLQLRIHTDLLQIRWIPPVSSWYIKCSKNIAKIFLTMPEKLRLGIGAQCTVNVKYLHPANLISEMYPNKTVHKIVENLLVIKQDTRNVNKRHQSAIIFCHDAFNISEVIAWNNGRKSLMN